MGAAAAIRSDGRQSFSMHPSVFVGRSCRLCSIDGSSTLVPFIAGAHPGGTPSGAESIFAASSAMSLRGAFDCAAGLGGEHCGVFKERAVIDHVNTTATTGPNMFAVATSLLS